MFCYHNATLQCLASLWQCKPFYDAVEYLKTPSLHPIAGKFARAVELVAEPDIWCPENWSQDFVLDVLRNPTLNPGRVFEFAEPNILREHDASELLLTFVSRLFEGNPAGNPFEIVLQRRILRTQADGVIADARPQDCFIDYCNALNILPDGEDAQLPAMLQRQIFCFRDNNNNVQTQDILSVEDRGSPPVIIVTNGQNACVKFSLQAVLIGAARYDCVAICCFVNPVHYVAYVRRGAAGHFEWWRCSDLEAQMLEGPLSHSDDLLRRHESVRFALFQKVREAGIKSPRADSVPTPTSLKAPNFAGLDTSSESETDDSVNEAASNQPEHHVNPRVSWSYRQSASVRSSTTQRCEHVEYSPDTVSQAVTCEERDRRQWQNLIKEKVRLVRQEKSRQHRQKFKQVIGGESALAPDFDKHIEVEQEQPQCKTKRSTRLSPLQLSLGLLMVLLAPLAVAILQVIYQTI